MIWKKRLPKQRPGDRLGAQRFRPTLLALLCVISFGLTSGLGSAALALWTLPVTTPKSAVTAPDGKLASVGQDALQNTLGPWPEQPLGLSQATLSANINPYDIAPPLESEIPAVAPLRLSQATLPANVNPYDIAPPLESEVRTLDLDPAVPASPSVTAPPPPPPPVVRPSPTVVVPTPQIRPIPAPVIPVNASKAAAPGGNGQPIDVTLPPKNIKPSAEMVTPEPQRPKFPPLPRQEVRGVWMTTSDMDILLDRDRLSGAMAQLAKLNFNTVYPVVWNSGYALHPSSVARRVGSPQIYRGAQNQDPLAEIIYQGHRNGLSVMPWFEFGFMVPESSELALAHPDWLSVKANGDTTANSAGGENAWLNPLKPEVQKFLTDLVMEVVDKYDVDGIQFDDHMSLPRDFGYDRYTKALYKQETGKNVPSNSADQAWMRWRADKITEFIGDLHDAVKTRKPKTVFSVSPNYQDFAYKFSLQDWLNWVRKDFVDEIVMQVYRDDYSSFVQQLDRAEIKEAKQKISTGIGILSGLPRRPIPMGQIEQQSRAAHQRGLGVAYFFYESLWDDAPEPEVERKQRFAQLFPRPASRLAQLAR